MFFIKVYGVIIAALTLVYIAFRYDFSDNQLFTFRWFGLEIDITNKRAGRIVCLSAALLMIPYSCTIDFSQFFPTKFEMEVFYDTKGLKASLAEFSNTELKSLDYNTANDKYADVYYKDLDLRLNNLLKYEGFFSLSDGIVHSNGETTFKVVQEKGFHRYHIDKAEGRLSHTLERPQYPTIQFKSFFEKLPSANDYIRPTFGDIIIKRSIVLKPSFKQIVAEHNKSNGVIFDHTLMGVTKVSLFPYPVFSNTVYFFKYKNKTPVPIGYAVYR